MFDQHVLGCGKLQNYGFLFFVFLFSVLGDVCAQEKKVSLSIISGMGVLCRNTMGRYTCILSTVHFL